MDTPLTDPLALGADALERLRGDQTALTEATARGKGGAIDGFRIEAAAVMRANGDLVIRGNVDAGIVVFPGAAVAVGQATPDVGTVVPVTVSLEIRSHVRTRNDPTGAGGLRALSALRTAVQACLARWRPDGARECLQFEHGAYLGRFGLDADDRRTGRLVERETGVGAAKQDARIWWVDRYTLRSVLDITGDDA